MENMKRILSYTRRGIDDYAMIEDGDKIAVGVSAGKDSLTLLCAMAYLRRFYPKKFTLIAITIDMGFEPKQDFSKIRELCDKLDVEYHIVPTEISKIIFDVRKEANPCSLCAKMRRGALKTAQELFHLLALRVFVGGAWRAEHGKFVFLGELGNLLFGHIQHGANKLYSHARKIRNGRKAAKTSLKEQI